MTNLEASMPFIRTLASQETLIYDEERGQLYRITAKVETVPAGLRRSYASRYGYTGRPYISQTRRIFDRLIDLGKAI